MSMHLEANPSITGEMVLVERSSRFFRCLLASMASIRSHSFGFQWMLLLICHRSLAEVTNTNPSDQLPPSGLILWVASAVV